jgi:sulfonate transport system substrate-binding protein
MKIKKILTLALAIVLVVTALVGCSSTSNDSSSNSEDGSGQRIVNIAIQPSAAFIPLYIAKENGWIEDALKEYNVTVNWNEFESGPPINESMASGESDIGTLGDVPTVSAIAAGQENEIFAMAAEGPESYALLVASDSKIENAGQLKGKKIATVLGSTGHNLTSKLLANYDLDVNSDIELVNIAAGDASTVLSTGEVDAVAIWEPNVSRLVSEGIGKIIGTGSDCGLLGVNPLIVRKEYAENNADVLKVIIEQYARGVQALSNLDDATKSAVSDDLTLDKDLLLDVAAKYDYTVKIADADTEGLNDTINFLVKIDTLEDAYDIKDYVNSTYIESADIDQYLK